MLAELHKAPVHNKLMRWKHEAANMTALWGEATFPKDRWVIIYSVLSTKQPWVASAAGPITLRTYKNTHLHAPKHAHCNTYVFVWIEQVSSSVLALLSGSKQQCSVDAFRHNGAISPHQTVLQTVPVSSEQEITKTNMTSARQTPANIRWKAWKDASAFSSSIALGVRRTSSRIHYGNSWD